MVSMVFFFHFGDNAVFQCQVERYLIKRLCNEV